MPAARGVLRGAPGKASRPSRGGRRSRQRAVADGRACGGPRHPRSVSRGGQGGGAGGGRDARPRHPGLSNERLRRRLGGRPPLPGSPLRDYGSGAQPHWGRAGPNASLYSARRPAPGPLSLLMKLSSLRLPLAGLVLLLAGLLLAATPSPEPAKPPTGLPPPFCGAPLRSPPSQPHLAGTPGNLRVSQYILERFRESGLEAEYREYQVLLAYPEEIRVEIVAPERVALSHPEPADPHLLGIRRQPRPCSSPALECLFS